MPNHEVPSAQAIGQLEFEFDVLQKLAGTGVIRAFAFQHRGTEAALILEDFGGETPTPGAQGMPLSTFFEFAIQAARAIGQIHAKNVVHKDLKPGNILMNPETHEVKVIDFHLASELSRERQTTLGTLQGSLPYLSPEQTGRMNRELDYRSDYYSFGVTLFELLTGQLPFEASDAMGWVHCHISKQAPAANGVNGAVPVGLSKLVAKLLAKDPDARYQSSHALVADLEKCQAEWKRSGTVEAFDLGVGDVPEAFRISQKLFGRGPELETLLGVFEETGKGTGELLLVAGASGVGKSSLIQEIHRPIVERNGYFVQGKFDQLERNVPYSAITQALRALARQLLAEPDDRLKAWRSRLDAALGENAQVMIDLLPELHQLLGERPAAPELDFADAQHRFRHVFRQLVAVFAQPAHPLVMFLDDLQWVDASSADLIVELLTNEVPHLLVICAYRDQEVRGDHLFASALRTIREQRSIHEIHLEPLDQDAVSQIVADTLRTTQASAEELTRLVFDKTEGNPFFTSELLESLHRNGALCFQVGEGRWSWDLAKVRGAAVRENVAGLLVQRLQQLPDGARNALVAAASLGNRFELATLGKVLELPPGQVAQALWPAVVQRIIVPLHGDYRLLGQEPHRTDLGDLGVSYQFQHDRVQQAAYSLVDAEARPRMHLRIGRLLLANLADDDSQVFDVASHLNTGASLIDSPKEREQLAELNARAAERAKQSSAFVIAERHFQLSIEQFTPTAEQNPKRFFELKQSHVECVFALGQLERATELAKELLALAPTTRDKGSVRGLQARIADLRGQFAESIEHSRQGLALFGVVLPEDPQEIGAKIGQGIGTMQAHLARVPVEDLPNLPDATDLDKVMAMDLLGGVVPSAIQSNPPLFVLAELMMFDLALSHGTTPISCKNFVDCGIIQGGSLGNYDVAYRLAKAAFKLLERYQSWQLEAAIQFVFAGFVSHWRAPFQEGNEAYRRGRRVAIERGSVYYGLYLTAHFVQRQLLIGRNLHECDAETRLALERFERAKTDNLAAGALMVVRAVARLTASEPDVDAAIRADDETTETVLATKNAQWIYSYGQCMGMVSYLLGELSAAEKYHEMAAGFLAAGAALFSMPDFCLFSSLVLTKKWGTLGEDERAAALETLKENQQKLEKWADNSPTNFAHKYHLLSAEIGRIENAPLDDVLKHYREAIRTTGDAFVHLRALANELEAEYWLARGDEKFARTAMRDAHQLYTQWGARAKAGQLETRHAAWFTAPAATKEALYGGTFGRTTTGDDAALDLASVLKATQAISSEVKPEKLYATLMSTVIENAGAQSGCLILEAEDDHTMYVEARASVDGSHSNATQRTELAQASGVCPDIVRYVSRTQQALVLDDAMHEGGFESDPYIKKNSVRSVLCVPIVNQRKLVAVLYAENSATKGAFTGEHLGVLRLIASQAAISITNAQLYKNLEQKVARRTAELAQKNREMEAMLDDMEQGVFTIDDDLRIRPQYSKHLQHLLGADAIAGAEFLPLLFADSDVGADAMDAMKGALTLSFGTERDLLECNLPHLVGEFQRERGGETRYLEVDWNPIMGPEGTVKNFLVAVRDVTLVRELRESAARRAREVEMLGQILDAGVEDFRRFVDATRNVVEQSRVLLQSPAPLDTEVTEALFRNMHSVKGNARSLVLTHLVDAVHEAEEAYARLRGENEANTHREELLRDLDRVLSLVQDYEAVFRRRLAQLTRGLDNRVEKTIEHIEHLVNAEPKDAAGTVDRIRVALEEVRRIPLAELVRDTSRNLPSLAQEAGKPTAIVDCEDGGVWVGRQWAPVVRDVLVQALRNSCVHGIEEREERERLGKPIQGTIRIVAERNGAGTRLRVSDDGRGLALDALGERLGTKNDDEIAEKVFASGVSTSREVSQLAGRGVGMDVLRSAVRGRGGEVKIAFTGERRNGYRPFEIVIRLPEESTAPTGLMHK